MLIWLICAVTARTQRNSAAFSYYVTPDLNCRPKYFLLHCHIIDFFFLWVQDWIFEWPSVYFLNRSVVRSKLIWIVHSASIMTTVASLNHRNAYKRYRNLANLIRINPYPTAFPYGNGMVLHFYQQQESSTTKTVHKVINRGLKAYV